MRRATLALLLGLLASAQTFAPGRAAAQTKVGFQLSRYEPSPAGDWSFSVDHLWYSSTRYFAGGVTMNYAHNPLVLGRFDESGDQFQAYQTIIAHQLTGHLDLAGSFLDRVLLTASLPVVFLEQGTPYGGVTPLDGQAVGDPRFGAYVRLFGQPYRSAASMSLGANVWVPLRKFADSISPQVSDQEVRFQPKVVLGGLARGLFWTVNASFLYRAGATLGTFGSATGSTVGSEVQLGVALGYASRVYRLAIVPEVYAASVVLDGKPFGKDYTSLEALVGIHYNIASQVQLSVGGGVGVLRQPGTPDGRALLRLSYAPIRKPPADRDYDGVPDLKDQCPDVHKGEHPDPDLPGCPQGDRDGDRVYDKEDRCPDLPAGRFADPARPGCPLSDRDGDGVHDVEDRCPDEHKGQSPDPARPGCPLPDRDGDGVFDAEDQCPDVPQGLEPDPQKRGCPLPDRDGDGVVDRDDLCPEVPQGLTPDPQKRGCPRGDRDKDGVWDSDDLCPDQPKGDFPDPARKGCPAPDRDKDTIVDPVDACPDQPGAPSPDPKKHGCPGLVKMEGGKIVIMNPVFFATDQDVILDKSFPVLQAVADALKASPHIKKVRVEGHTDDRGKADHNTELSDRRAKSVRKYLISQGVEEARLEAQGFGPTRPIQSNKTAKGRAANRRVDFIVIDPPYVAPPVDPSQVVSPDTGDGKKKGGKRRPGKKK